MGRAVRRLCLATVVSLVFCNSAIGGMPSALPEDFSRVFRLSESGSARLQAISFFLLSLAVVSLAVMGLWNYLRRDFTRMPRLSYGKAVGVVVAWGLLFVIVLTMISGARELMTPGAWKKQGATYSLEPSAAPQSAVPKPAAEGSSSVVDNQSAEASK